MLTRVRVIGAVGIPQPRVSKLRTRNDFSFRVNYILGFHRMAQTKQTAWKTNKPGSSQASKPESSSEDDLSAGGKQLAVFPVPSGHSPHK